MTSLTAVKARLANVEVSVVAEFAMEVRIVLHNAIFAAVAG
jgi:hypothetical protein